jgi:cbb3-type cytochrome oxidase subunit 3
VTGFMAREFFGASPLLVLPIVALVLFAVAFIALALRTARMDRGEVDERARLALEGEREATDG